MDFKHIPPDPFGDTLVGGSGGTGYLSWHPRKSVDAGSLERIPKLLSLLAFLLRAFTEEAEREGKSGVHERGFEQFVKDMTAEYIRSRK